MSNFTENVYKICRLIPSGRVSTYQAIAKALGQPEASRAVGNALNKNPYAPEVPCHRVIRSDGQVGGFAHGSVQKTAILKEEGIIIHQGKIDLKIFYYEPKSKR